MSPKRDKYSLWIVPRGETGERLQTLIDALAEEHGAPVFTPHLSLVANIFATPEELPEVKRRATELAGSLGSFTIKLTELSYLDEEFRCLFYLAESEGLERAYQTATEYFPQAGDEHFASFPHLSVLYGEFERTTKEEIIRQHQPEPMEFTVNEIDLYLTNAPVSTWQHVCTFT